MRKIHNLAIKDNLYVSQLTDMEGDCLFESLEYVGFCDDRHMMRKSVADIFMMFGDLNIIPNYNESLKTVFSYVNEIPYESVLFT
tara:strand:+ start:553 stop:807 length:255 start_codon:yes stop_codon:yes gene_type:complete